MLPGGSGYCGIICSFKSVAAGLQRCIGGGTVLADKENSGSSLRYYLKSKDQVMIGVRAVKRSKILLPKPLLHQRILFFAAAFYTLGILIGAECKAPAWLFMLSAGVFLCLGIFFK